MKVEQTSLRKEHKGEPPQPPSDKGASVGRERGDHMGAGRALDRTNHGVVGSTEGFDELV